MHLFLSFLHLLPALIAATQNQSPYTPTDYFLLDCGSITNSTSLDGRNWDGDSNPKFSPHNIQTISTASKPSEQDPSVTQVPYITARIFQSSKFTYSFPVSNGTKFVRLYFYPATYSGLNKSKSSFSVTANTFILLSNFSAFLTASTLNPPVAFFVKEFVINVKYNQRLNITFIPSPSSYAFINGIEVFSIPNNLYLFNRNDPITFVHNPPEPFYFDDSTALETMYRLNVGGKDVSNTEDTGMFRTWSQDLDYVVDWKWGYTFRPPNVRIQYTEDTPAYTAPEVVYTTARTMGKNPNDTLNYNLTWNFLVDSGFIYLVRLHFCETQPEVVKENQRVFTIFINNQTAEEEADVIQWTGGTKIPIYKEYVVFVPNGSQGKQDLWLALHPNTNTDPRYTNVILNGVEIFKLSNSDGSLAAFNSEPVVVPSPTSPIPQQKIPKKRFSPIATIIGGVLGGVFAISAIYFFVSRRNMTAKVSAGSVTSETKSSWVTITFSNPSRSTNTHATSLPSDHCDYFSLVNIKAATRNFDDQLIIGSGGFGNVYKGYTNGGSTTIAIKRLNPTSKQGAREFWTEIEMLSKLRHVNLVPLIGYSEDQGEMILVYEYMARGTLRDHLYKGKNPPLPWKRRMEICIGAAHGLHYLRCGAKHTIIHRDVKSTNILLDEKWVAKISDFGLSRMGPTSMSQTHVSTMVKGSFGYVDPEYHRRRQLTVKSDVYSFGVVLFEVLCARPALVPGLPKEQVSLAQWGRKCYQSGTLDQIMDPHLRAEVATACLKKFGEIAESCVRDQGIERPEMSDVVWGLEFALQLQENADKERYGGNGVNMSEIQFYAIGAQASPSDQGGEVSTADDDDLFSGSTRHLSD